MEDIEWINMEKYFDPQVLVIGKMEKHLRKFNRHGQFKKLKNKIKKKQVATPSTCEEMWRLKNDEKNKSSYVHENCKDDRMC